MLSGFAALRPQQDGPTVSVWGAAHDLGAGQTLRTADLRPLSLPSGTEPVGSVPLAETLAGRVVAGPVRAGEAFTDVRLLGPGLLRGYGHDVVATPVRLSDGAVAGLLRAGDVVDVLAAAGPDDLAAAGSAGARARRIAAGVRVLTVPRPAADRDTSALVVLATSATDALSLAQAAATMRLSVVLRAQ